MPHFEFTGIAVITELDASIDNVATSIDIKDPSGWPPGTGTKVVSATLGDASAGDTEEKVEYSSLSGNTLTVSKRGFDGTAAQSWPIGTKIRHTISAVFATEATDHIFNTTLDQHTQYHNSSRHAAVAHTQAMLGAGSVGTPELIDGTVTSPKLAANSVTPGKVANNAVDTAQIVDDAVVTSKIPDNAITTPKVPDGAITLAKLESGLLSSQVADDGAGSVTVGFTSLLASPLSLSSGTYLLIGIGATVNSVNGRKTQTVRMQDITAGSDLGAANMAIDDAGANNQHAVTVVAVKTFGATTEVDLQIRTDDSAGTQSNGGSSRLVAVRIA